MKWCNYYPNQESLTWLKVSKTPIHSVQTTLKKNLDFPVWKSSVKRLTFLDGLIAWLPGISLEEVLSKSFPGSTNECVCQPLGYLKTMRACSWCAHIDSQIRRKESLWSHKGAGPLGISEKPLEENLVRLGIRSTTLPPQKKQNIRQE